ncbi:MAG: hypothetical protein Q9164_004182 [Protoblastenia rupestris]
MAINAADNASRHSYNSHGSSFLGLTFRHGKSNSDGLDEDAKGPLGLNLLHDAPDPIVDFVFVHGLGGGSRKTWSYSSDLKHFWPRWLPEDSNFHDVRIHSFGYNSDWTSMKPDVSNISDFALALLNALRYVESIRLPERTPIIFIVHSMGGLVVKKACLLAWNDPAFEHLAPRFRTVVFFATPHRGSDGASVVNSVLRLSFAHSPRQYVEELERGSGTLQDINEYFRHIADKLELYSFFETVKTTFVFSGVGNVMIVDRSSATLDYPHEQRFPVQANHRGICKFEARHDSKYLLVKSVLASIVRARGEARLVAKAQERKGQLKTLQGFLNAPDKPEDDLTSLRDTRANSHACSWIESKSYFSVWRDHFESPQFLWLRARPAYGKSVLASYVVDHLTAAGYDCSYFFFKHRHPQKSKISGLLRSIAHQMSMPAGNHAVRESLLDLKEDDVHINDDDDEQAIWRKVFAGGIFRTTFRRPQYWVIDGIDECDHGTTIFPLLAKLENFPLLRVFLTSRDSNELSKSSSQLKSRLVNEEISMHDTRQDIQTYAEEQVAQLNLEDDDTRQYVTATIMGKSSGCFLWVKLVLKELEDAHLRSSIEQILEDVPEGMDPLYSRILDLMSKQIPASSKALVHTILTWIMCAVRPLTFGELHSALAIDIGEQIYRLRQALDSMCSQLVLVDSNRVVHPVHETARDYLLGTTDSEWGISRAKGSTRLLESCLKYLTGQEMANFRNRRTVSALDTRQERSPFSSYACVAFSDHLRTATASSDHLLILLAKFLETNVLSWIELLVREYRSVHYLTVAAKNLKLFLERRTKYKSPLGKEFSTADAWSVDLERIATKFGKSLLNSPAAVFSLVPALCPSQSAIRKQFGRDARGIEVSGNELATWDDRLSCIIHRGKAPSAVACAEEVFAVGFSKPPGLIWTYGISTCQEKYSMAHPESIRILAFSSAGDLLASSGREHLRIWNALEGSCLFAFRTRLEPLSVVFAQNDKLVMAASKGNHTCSWDLRGGGTEQDTCSWYDAERSVISQNVPSVVAFNRERSLLAAVYKGFPISLWEIEDYSFLGYVHRDPAQLGDLAPPRGLDKKAAHAHVEAMIFNPKTDQLVASYADGELCCFDPWSQELETKENVYIQTMACSPDGRTLACGDSCGTIQLRDFRTLRLLYKIVAFDDPIRSLTFTANSLRLLDIRGSTCNVWEPSALVRSEQTDDQSTSDAMERSPVIVESDDAEDVNLLTALVPGPGSSILLGNEEGNVAMFDVMKEVASQAQVLYNHVAGAPVSALSWCEPAAIFASADLSGQIVLSKMTSMVDSANSSCVKVFEDRLVGQAIRSVILDASGRRLLVLTSETAYLYATTGEIIDSLGNADRTHTWLSDPVDPGNLLCLNSSGLRIFDWFTLRQKSSVSFINRAITDVIGPQPVIKQTALIPKSKKILLRFVTSRPRSQSTSLRIFYLQNVSATQAGENPRHPHLSPARSGVEPKPLLTEPKDGLEPTQDPIKSTEDEDAFVLPQRLGEGLEPLSKQLEMIIGTIPNTSEVAFLNKTLWVCTVDIDKSEAETSYTRYFFVPHEWITNNEDMMIRVTAQKDVVLAKQDKVIIFRRGLRHGEKVTLETER